MAFDKLYNHIRDYQDECKDKAKYLQTKTDSVSNLTVKSDLTPLKY